MKNIGTKSGVELIMTNGIYSTMPRGLVVLAACVIASTPAFGQSLPDEREIATRINAANSLLRDGKVDDAIVAYRDVAHSDQHQDELNYNLAVAEYRKGNIDAAEQLFSQVAGSGNAEISSESRYNLGNCHYAKAVEMADNDKPAAIERLRQAIANYRGSLRGNPNNPDARANIELAGELIRKLQEELNQQKEQQQQNPQQSQDQDQNQQQKNESQEQNKQDQQQERDQKNQQEKADQSESQQSESQQSDEKSQDEKSQQDHDQKNSDSQDSSSANKTDEQKKQDEASAPEPQEKDESQQEKQKKEQAPRADKNKTQPQDVQQRSGQQQQPEDQGEPEDQQMKDQPVPDGELKAAGEQDKNKDKDNSAAMVDLDARDGLMTREEALKMLQSVRDRDMLRRMQQQRQERSRHVSVDRDW